MAVELILVFDAYRVKDSETRNYKRGGVEIVYTKYNQTADSYIETLVPHLKSRLSTCRSQQ